MRFNARLVLAVIFMKIGRLDVTYPVAAKALILFFLLISSDDRDIVSIAPRFTFSPLFLLCLLWAHLLLELVKKVSIVYNFCVINWSQTIPIVSLQYEKLSYAVIHHWNEIFLLSEFCIGSCQHSSQISSLFFTINFSFNFCDRLFVSR